MPAALTLDFVPPLALARGPSFLLGVALLGLALGALLVGLAVHAGRLARAKARERAELRSPADLRPGARTVVTGTIEAPGAGGPPVQVVIDERRGPAVDSWLESSRRIEARPFAVDVDGTRVEIEADRDVFVAAALEPGPVLPAGHRQSHIALGHGARIVAYGALARERQTFAGYRGGAEGWTLRAPKRGRLVLATESLDSRYDARIRLLRRFVAFAVPAWLGFHAYFTLPLLAAAFAGTQSSARVVSVEYSEQHAIQRELVTEADDGLTLTTKVKVGTAQDLNLHDVKRVPLLRYRSWQRACFVGGEAWTSAPGVLGGLFVALLALTSLRQAYRRATPWYDRT